MAQTVQFAEVLEMVRYIPTDEEALVGATVPASPGLERADDGLGPRGCLLRRKWRRYGTMLVLLIVGGLLFEIPGFLKFVRETAVKDDKKHQSAPAAVATDTDSAVGGGPAQGMKFAYHVKLSTPGLGILLEE
ncbi:hypothetical protein BU16DRAFT_566108 [Lophium mytilinum]|uniref:Uncharacterized protein n=1 Tax=Lophium mytilinum TaxID=390894 RepID=A0A6A6QG82_9PEZI|nr:hypothetical protein BU16DRAFT_566108 [Lophium mytilinum]